MKNRYGETAYVNVSDSKEYFRFSECDKCSVKIRVQGTVHEVATWEKKHTLKNDIFVINSTFFDSNLITYPFAERDTGLASFQNTF